MTGCQLVLTVFPVMIRIDEPEYHVEPEFLYHDT